MAGAKPAAPAMALVVFRKSRRDQLRLFPPDPITQLLFDRVISLMHASWSMIVSDHALNLQRPDRQCAAGRRTVSPVVVLPIGVAGPPIRLPHYGHAAKVWQAASGNVSLDLRLG
jgi:hypothetical protein